MKFAVVSSIKFKSLKGRLGINDWQAIGVLESLWMLTTKHAPQGDIGTFSNYEICLLIEWGGNPDEFIEALVVSGWLKKSDEYRLLVSDWSIHVPNWLVGNLAKHRKKIIDDGGIVEDRKDRTVRDVPAGLRFEVLNRDGFRCRYCGRTSVEVEIQCDHVVPLAAGGSNDEDNLVAACIDCNLGKSAKPLI